MTRIALTTALVLGLSAPAFANEQLARSLGVDAGDYTTAQLVQLGNALSSDEHIVAKAITDGSAVVSTQSFGAPAADAAIARLFAEDDEKRIYNASGVADGSAVVSTQSFRSATADMLIARLFDEDDEKRTSR